MKCCSLLLTACCCLFVITSCKYKSKESDVTILHCLNIAKEPLEEPPIYKKTPEIVRLETDTSCLLRFVRQVEMNDSYVFVADTYNLYSFTRSGKFVSQIGSKGEAPNEYIVFRTFYVDNVKEQISILDDYKNVFINYDFTGKYISTVKLPSKVIQSCSQALLLKDDKLMLHHMLDMYDTNPFSLFDMKKHEQIGGYFSYRPIYVDDRIISFSSNAMSSTKEGVSLILPLCDTIYSYSLASSSFMPKFIVETPQKMVPKDQLGKTKDLYNELINWGQQDFFTGFSRIFETDSHILLEYLDGGIALGYALFNKATHDGNYYLLSYDEVMKTIPFYRISCTYKNKFVAVVYPESLLRLKNIKNEKLQEAILDLKEDDNPCLVFYEF